MEVTQWAKFALGLLAVVMTAIGGVCWQQVRRLSDGEHKARHAALHDALTGLPNRAALASEIEMQMQRLSVPVVVAFVDLDGFKEVNDTFDHATGDRLLLAVSKGIRYLVRDGFVCRLGGDEFVALFAGENAVEQGTDFAADLIELVKTPFDFEGRIAAVGASIGLVEAGGVKLDVAELMRRADVAMYRAKQQGKNRACFYLPEFDGERDGNLSIECELRKILEENRLRIAYQPVFDGATRQIVGVEALARWPEDSLRKVPPDQFVRIAENRGLIDDLGLSILQQACRDASAWPGLKIAVNVSPVQLRNPAFVSRTLATIKAAGIDPARVEIEVTETWLVDDAERAGRVFDELRRAGISIALDDFGTGYASVGSLKQFKFDRIKIDRSLVIQVGKSANGEGIIRGTLLIAKALGANTTVEGVDSKQLLDDLLELGCRDMQGYFLSKPVSAQAVSELLNPKTALVA